MMQVMSQQMIKNRSIVTIDDVGDDDLNEIFTAAEEMDKLIKSGKKISILESRIMCTLFYEPSTRTRLSFESAMHRLGGGVITMADVKTSSVSKGETLADTIRMADAYSDVIVIRHPLEGAARLASRFTSKPVINAGDGSGQHPTQTIMDLYTIRKELGKIRGLKVTLLGDLKYGRTVHSLILALSKYDAKIKLISPPSLRIPEYLLHRIGDKSSVEVLDTLEGNIADTDVLYVTRIQKERFTDPNEYQSLIGSYSVNNNVLESMKRNSIIMHPLPRVDEIAPEVDQDARAAYFRQAANGVPVRMAIISKVLGGI
jgi:aspartate carbamoyltransferase catalytic subunit